MSTAKFKVGDKVRNLKAGKSVGNFLEPGEETEITRVHERSNGSIQYSVKSLQGDVWREESQLEAVEEEEEAVNEEPEEKYIEGDPIIATKGETVIHGKIGTVCSSEGGQANLLVEVDDYNELDLYEDGGWVFTKPWVPKFKVGDLIVHSRNPSVKAWSVEEVREDGTYRLKQANTKPGDYINTMHTATEEYISPYAAPKNSEIFAALPDGSTFHFNSEENGYFKIGGKALLANGEQLYSIGKGGFDHEWWTLHIDSQPEA